jgi:hypothetical protein
LIHVEIGVLISVGLQKEIEPSESDLERFFSMIRFETREKLKDLPEFQEEF